MSKKKPFFVKYISELVLLFFLIYSLLPFLSPILLSFDENSSVGIGIQKLYSHFCHQRVDRSLFLFGEKSFYTLEELIDIDYVEYSAGYPYWGNEEIGYKVAYCIRDIAIYTSVTIFGFFLVLYMNFYKKIPKFPLYLILILALPMVFDGVFQIMVSAFDLAWVPNEYMESNLKRIITGVFFGIAMAMIVFVNLKDASGLVYNEKEE